jgi:bifunctional DNA-binding transcriptional regulator/antitoxin component of YhaV-PrlF toxin-antitoxin module
MGSPSWENRFMIPTPSEVTVDQNGMVALPISILVEAGITPGDRVLAVSQGDGRIVLRRLDDAVDALLRGIPV